ncbi:hypothetical protein PDIDSM_3358 [Penicillium digitatum]|nr:hypothetical protein PDIDSM_3358 [Penicillium digitatum]
MAESPAYPSNLDSIFDAANPLKDRIDPIRLTSDNIVPILNLPLTHRVLGHDASNESLEQVASGEISYTTFVADQARAALRSSDDLTTEQKQSQLLHLGLAALFSFLQSNVTGPPLEFSSAEAVLPSSLRTKPTILKAVRAKIIRDLTVDGEAAYKLTPNPELFAVAKALLADAGSDGPLLAKPARMRTNFLHQKMLSEVTSTLQDVIYKDVEILDKAELNPEERSRFLLERATIHTHHRVDAKAREDIDQAAKVRRFEFALTGKMGKRTKFQDRDISQLVVLAKSADETTQFSEPSGPKNLNLDDDTLLEAISFSDQKPDEESLAIQDKVSPALDALDANNQPILNPVDSALLLALASAITNTSPENGLTREETNPYATRVLDGGSSNWQIYTQALLVRSRVEGYRSRTVERAVLQMQALVDQVIADTATSDDAAQTESGDPTTFLPRPEQSESAPAADRLEHIWILNFSTRWSLEAELAKRWVDLGGLRTALEIYERLHVGRGALCYAATEREGKAKNLIAASFTKPPAQTKMMKTSNLKDQSGHHFQQMHRDEKLYERAWVSLGNDTPGPAVPGPSLPHLHTTTTGKAEEAYKKSLHINRLNQGAWFALGCVQLELQKWQEATDTFTRTLEQPCRGDAAHARPEPAPRIIDETTGEVSAAEVDPHKRKREALSALQRAAQLKGTDARIWDNVLTVAASIPPPATPFREVITAQKRIIELIGTKQGEKCIDVAILGMLVDFLSVAFEYEALLIRSDDPAEAPIVRTGTIPGQIISLVDQNVIPLITHSSVLWHIVARVEVFRGRPSKAFEAYEKAWRATIAANAQGAFQMGDEKPWLEIVRATEKLVRDGYAKFGPMDREDQKVGGDQETELVAKDWRFKARSAVRGIMGKGKDFWDGTEGWDRLKQLQSEVTGN